MCTVCSRKFISLLVLRSFSLPPTTLWMSGFFPRALAATAAGTAILLLQTGKETVHILLPRVLAGSNKSCQIISSILSKRGIREEKMRIVKREENGGKMTQKKEKARQKNNAHV